MSSSFSSGERVMCWYTPFPVIFQFFSADQDGRICHILGGSMPIGIHDLSISTHCNASIPRRHWTVLLSLEKKRYSVVAIKRNRHPARFRENFGEPLPRWWLTRAGQRSMGSIILRATVF